MVSSIIMPTPKHLILILILIIQWNENSQVSSEPIWLEPLPRPQPLFIEDGIPPLQRRPPTPLMTSLRRNGHVDRPTTSSDDLSWSPSFSSAPSSLDMNSEDIQLLSDLVSRDNDNDADLLFNPLVQDTRRFNRHSEDQRRSTEKVRDALILDKLLEEAEEANVPSRVPNVNGNRLLYPPPPPPVPRFDQGRTLISSNFPEESMDDGAQSDRPLFLTPNGDDFDYGDVYYNGDNGATGQFAGETDSHGGDTGYDVLYEPMMEDIDGNEGWSFSRHSRHDTKKPGPTYFLHDDEDGVSKEVFGSPLQMNSQPPTDWQQANVMANNEDVNNLNQNFQFGSRQLTGDNLGLQTITGNSKQAVDESDPSLLANIFRMRKGHRNASGRIRRERARENGGILGRSFSQGSGTTVTATTTTTTSEKDRRLQALTLASCGVVLALLASAGLAYGLRRNDYIRSKFNQLTFLSDKDAKTHYEDLCRQRMQGNNNAGGGGGGARAKEKDPEKGPKGPTDSKAEKQKALKTKSSESSDGVHSSKSERSSTSSWNEDSLPANMDISSAHMILSYMEDHLKKADRLEREWDALCAYEADSVATHAALMAQNGKKNRYPNILPYDHSRVMLNDLLSASGTDYINASTITDHNPRAPVYIATQGPLTATIPDFWQMIWEQGCSTMVMLTRLAEGGISMCARYWPEEGTTVYHNYELTLEEEHIWCDDYLMRTLSVKNLKTSEKRTVTQFHFLSWPENGVPTSPKSLLDFRRKVNKSLRGKKKMPILLHCNDGSGRTGTYCLIDMVLNRMSKEGAKEIDIAATLEHIRDQRMGMVKSKMSFEFVLTAIAFEVQATLKALNQS